MMDLLGMMCNLLMFGLLFILTLKEGLSIRCYSCNSNYVKSCSYVQNLPEVERQKFSINCDQLQEANVTDFTMCRIISQDIDGEERLIRQCASGGRPDKCYTRTGTYRIKMEYCECTTDLCNAGNSFCESNLISIALFLPVLLFLLA